MILYNDLIDQIRREPAAFVNLDIGWYLGLASAVTMLIGAAAVQMARGGAIRRPPGTF